MDVSDDGTVLEERMRAEAVARRELESTLRSLRTKTHRPNTNCTKCSAPIPPQRREAAPGCTRCVECEKADEARVKRTGR